jgi:dTDP-4-dehydrorhamnose reductase
MTWNQHTIAVTGATGQLGREICRQLGPAAVPLSRAQLDLAEPAMVRAVVEKLRPAVVINCAAWTAVDAAESHPDACRRVNADAVAELAAACNTIDAMLVQVSTDYVFGADATRGSPYAETDTPGPVNEYGASKLAGEQAAVIASKHLIARTCGLYSVGANGPVRGRNFADTMLVLAAERDELRIVNDQHCTPSFVPHVAQGILGLLACRATGLFHVVNSGSTTWHGFASELFRVAGQKMTLHPISSGDYPTPAKRPGYSVLDTNKFSALTGDALPPWQAGIQEYVRATKPTSPDSERTRCAQFS